MSNPKIPYTTSGISLVQNQMIAALKSGVTWGGIAEDEYNEDGELISGFTTSMTDFFILSPTIYSLFSW